MCGRTSLFVPRTELEGRFDATVADPASYSPRYNIAPTEPLAILEAESAEIEQVTWGIPGAGGQRHINARIETVDERPTFSDAWQERPCLVLSSGFYKWGDRSNGGRAQPYRIYRPDDVAFAMAGIVESTEKGRAMAILTREANDVLRPIHDRMPVVLSRATERAWLQADPDERKHLPGTGDSLEAYQVDSRMNNASIDDPSIIEPLEHDQADLSAFDQSS
ncbi:MAG: SOS response-associated peptidase [Natrialbaceae archaeon]|nr:SOS response-associated peptidase [Natrialbaceae archaeon]